MNLDGLKELAQTSEIFDERMQNIQCVVCGHNQRQFVTIYENLQTRNCPGEKGNSHVLYFDARGKFLWAVEHLSGESDWRDPIDHARTVGVKPQTMAWEVDKRPRRVGGRKPKKGKGKGGYWIGYEEEFEDGNK